MRVAFISVALSVLATWGANGQSAMAVKNKEEVFNTPLSAIQTKLKRVKFSEEDLNSYMWNFSHDTMGQDVKIRRNIGESETGPYWSRRSVWADATMAARMKEFGAGKYAHEAVLLPTAQDRWEASQQPEADYPEKAEHLAILAAVYRHFFGYRAQGMGRDAHTENARLHVKDVYFLGLGPHVIDAPSSLLAALQADPGIQKDGILIQPLRNVLEVTDEAIRDRATGAYGIAFRVDEIGEVKDGELRVAATFTEREGFWFTRELTLRRGKDGWSVVEDTDYVTR